MLKMNTQNTVAKTLIGCAAATVFTVPVAAEHEAPAYERWAGGFLEYYSTDNDKPEPTGYFDEGYGFGGELGWRFDPHWAARVELALLEIDADPNSPIGMDEDGHSYGIDAVYFLDNDAAYLFGGLRQQSLDATYRMAAAGIGKHWDFNDRVKIITEAQVFHDFGEGFNDYAVKLGFAYTFGAASKPAPRNKDSDGDGVMDSRDQCPNTPAGTSVDATGCNNDLDGDGVLNGQDQCPNTPRGTAVDAKGCALAKDLDHDGVTDDIDQCPDSLTSERVDETGCVIFEEKDLSVSLNVLFGNNSAEVSNPNDPQIREFAEFLQRFVNTSAVIEGHTSALGRAEYNLSLSERRAQAVKDLLVNQYGIDAGRLAAVGFGETQLLDSSNTAEAHRVNRRIEAQVSATVKEKVTE